MTRLTQLPVGIADPKQPLESKRTDKHRSVHFEHIGERGTFLYGCRHTSARSDFTHDPAHVTCAACLRWLCEHPGLVNRLAAERRGEK